MVPRGRWLSVFPAVGPPVPATVTPRVPLTSTDSVLPLEVDVMSPCPLVHAAGAPEFLIVQGESPTDRVVGTHCVFRVRST